MAKDFSQATHVICGKSFSFTLAEVLIVLGIIGLIADMTIPALMNNVQNAQLEAGFKTAYSLISQAVKLMSANDGPVYGAYGSIGTNVSLPSFVENLAKYLKGTSKVLDGPSSMPIIQSYKSRSGMDVSTWMFDDGSISIANGMTIYIEGYYGKPIISIDVNGYMKKPNKWGYDLFSFIVTDSDGVLPLGSERASKYLTDYRDYDLTDYGTFCNQTNSFALNGISCANRAMTEKDYFKNLK